VIRAPGAEQVSSWAAPGSGSGGGAPAGPDARRRGRDWHGASSSTGSFAVAASAMMGISDTGVKRSSQCSDAGRGCQQRREGPISSLHCTANTLSVGLVGREDLLSRVGDEHLQERPVHAVTACAPLRGVPTRPAGNAHATWRCTPARWPESPDAPFYCVCASSRPPLS
jgi:hypothetical protein